jgi:PilZ domain-containing protein
MSRALICSQRPLEELQQTLIAREDVARYHTDDWRDALGAARHLPVDVLFVDAETPGARDLVREMRSEPLTRHIALAVLARRGSDNAFTDELRGRGIEILRVPPGADWDERLVRLLHVTPRRAVRQRVDVDVYARGEGSAMRIAARDVSVGGMLVESAEEFEIGEKLRVRFSLPRAVSPLEGTAWVVRKGRPRQWGLEFLYLDGSGVDELGRYVSSC